MAPRVVLVGPPGSGKTTVGPLVARELGVPFRDTDDAVATTAGMPLPDIFVAEGEAGFRVRETAAVVRALTDSADGVVALGGGAIEDDGVRANLTGRFVVHLTVGANEAAKRVGISGPRPLLLGNVRTTWNRMLHRRDPLYREVATVSIATDDRAPVEVAAEIVSELNRRSP